jgi:nanoRNase/pAp phosphatase (c-di-AMP/oligoRNAs hydrolase)
MIHLVRLMKGPEISDVAEMLRAESKVILVHGNADMDALGSAYALSRCFPPADICAPGGLDRITRMVSEKLGIAVLDTCDTADYDLTVVVDTSSPEQFKPGSVEVPEGSLVIDHHAPTGKWEGMHFHCDSSKVSCCEIIKDILDAEGITMDRETSLVMLGGMLTDSGHFHFADPGLLRAFAALLEESGIGMDEAMDLTRSDTTISERIAVMKAVGRSRFDRVGDMLVATTTGSSFEAGACRALLLAGADVAFVCSQRDDNFRLSARTTQEMVRRGLHLGKMLGDLGGETSTDGGGHGGAAGLSGVGDAEAMLNMCMSRAMDFFREVRASSAEGSR